MTLSTYVLPKVWKFEKENGGVFEKINRPRARDLTELFRKAVIRFNSIRKARGTE
jgi:hypothetical protein